MIIFYGAILFLLFKLFQKFGFLPDKESRKVSEAGATNLDRKGNEQNALNPAYVTDLINSAGKGKRIKLLPSATAEKYAQQIYDSKHFYGDTDSKTVLVFKNIKFKSQVSQVSDSFSKLFGQDLATFLDFLD